MISVHFGSVWLRLAPFRVCSGSVSGPFRVRFGGVGWGRGGVGERGFCKGKEYHYSNPTGWAIFRAENVKEQRERRKTMADKGKDKKEEETLKYENPPPFRFFFSWPFLIIELFFEMFNQNLPTQWG